MTRMRLVLVLAFVVGLIGSVQVPVMADMGCPGLTSPVAPMGFEQITVSTVAIGFTSTKIVSGAKTATMAVVTIETTGVRYRDDGTAPTSSVGHLISASSTIPVCGQTTVANAKFIRPAGADAIINVSYYTSSAI